MPLAPLPELLTVASMAKIGPITCYGFAGVLTNR
jgi:hypothetical protein